MSRVSTLVSMLLLFPLQFLLVVGAPGNVLLCVAPGHFELEAPHPGVRCHGGGNDIAPASKCVDVAVSVAPMNVPPDIHLAGPPIDSVAALPPFSAAELRSFSTAPLWAASPSFASVSLRTVVLLS